jgi:HD-like signal output (HDOD) protein
VAGDLFTVGLLAQIGSLALATAHPLEYSNLVVQDLTRSELLAREQALLHTDHLQLSVAMMEHWGISADYARPFGAYENSASAQPADTASAALRARLAHSCWLLADVLAREGSDAALDHPECVAALRWLELERPQLQEQLQEIEAVWRVWLVLIAHKG